MQINNKGGYNCEWIGKRYLMARGNYYLYYHSLICKCMDVIMQHTLWRYFRHVEQSLGCAINEHSENIN